MMKKKSIVMRKAAVNIRRKFEPKSYDNFSFYKTFDTILMINLNGDLIFAENERLLQYLAQREREGKSLLNVFGMPVKFAFGYTYPSAHPESLCTVNTIKIYR